MADQRLNCWELAKVAFEVHLGPPATDADWEALSDHDKARWLHVIFTISNMLDADHRVCIPGTKEAPFS